MFPISYPYRVIAEQLIARRTSKPMTRESLHALRTELRYPEGPLSRPTLLEEVAYATLHVLAARAPALAPETHNPLENVWCIARPFEDDEARLVIYMPPRVLYQTACPTSGPLRDWADIIQGIWEGCAPAFAPSTDHLAPPRSLLQPIIQDAYMKSTGISEGDGLLAWALQEIADTTAETATLHEAYPLAIHALEHGIEDLHTLVAALQTRYNTKEPR